MTNAPQPAVPDDAERHISVAELTEIFPDAPAALINALSLNAREGFTSIAGQEVVIDETDYLATIADFLDQAIQALEAVADANGEVGFDFEGRMHVIREMQRIIVNNLSIRRDPSIQKKLEQLRKIGQSIDVDAQIVSQATATVYMAMTLCAQSSDSLEAYRSDGHSAFEQRNTMLPVANSVVRPSVDQSRLVA